MKRRSIILMLAMLILFVGAKRAAAQGSQGVGSGSSGTVERTSKLKTSHSLNPVRWVKKDKKANDEFLAGSDRNVKLSAKLQESGLLAPEISLQEACQGFKSLGECVAALHASHNVGVNFTCLKWDLNGLQPSGDTSSCATSGSGALSLDQAIHILKPNADAAAEAKSAHRQSHDDLRSAKR